MGTSVKPPVLELHGNTQYLCSWTCFCSAGISKQIPLYQHQDTYSGGLFALYLSPASEQDTSECINDSAKKIVLCERKLLLRGKLCSKQTGLSYRTVLYPAVKSTGIKYGELLLQKVHILKCFLAGKKKSPFSCRQIGLNFSKQKFLLYKLSWRIMETSAAKDLY